VNRKVLERIKEAGDIFWTWSDRDWVLEGAAVHVSLIGFDDGTEQTRLLNGNEVSEINSDLTARTDLTIARNLKENALIAFQGPSPKAPFDIKEPVAQAMLSMPTNINNRPNSDVIRPMASAIDLVQRQRNIWTIDFGFMPLTQAADYEMPFEYVRHFVYPARQDGTRAKYAGNWWQYGRPRLDMRRALKGKGRYVATPRHSKHRIFVWLDQQVLANDSTIVFARDDDYFFGVLQSRPHELWARATGTQLREVESGFRYTPTTTFETFPFPWPPGQEPADDPRVAAIAEGARTLVARRDAWLNPPDATPAQLKERTLTNLYNQRPAWLDLAHRALDAAVFAAYGWPPNLADAQVLERLLALNLERAGREIGGDRSPRRRMVQSSGRETV
jgi:hypothetical protein